MKIRFIKNFLALGLVGLAIPVVAQYSYFKPMEGFGIEASLTNTSLRRMPMYRNAITSLTVQNDYIIGGTTAQGNRAPFLFVASLAKREMLALKDLNDDVPGQTSIRTGFFRTDDNALYAGTMATDTESGHLLRVVVGADAGIRVTDLGTPAPGEGVFSLTGSNKSKMIYGISYPSGYFFSYNIVSKSFKVYKNSAVTKTELTTLVDEYHQKPGDYLSGAMTTDGQGLVYTSQPVNRLVIFNPADESFTTLSELPAVWGRRTLGRTESWTRTADGLLYGGNAGDGQLFELNPTTRKVKNLGKPAMMNRLRGLCVGADGRIYGLSGALPGYVHLFSYSPSGEGFTDLGNPQFILKAPGIEQGIEWRGFQLSAIAASEDGKYIVMGEDEALSQLLVFPVDDGAGK